MTDLQVRLAYSKSEKDDWTKVEDKALRKKIQDRLAKRKSRTNGPKDSIRKRPSKKTCDIAKGSEVVATRSDSEYAHTDTSSDALDGVWTASSSNSESNQDDVDHIIQSFFATPGLAEHRHINLMEYSVFRAFLQNASLLSLDLFLLEDDNAISPWTKSNPCPASTPRDLCPTLIQLSTPHHPYLDTIGPPSLRESVLLALLTDEQEDQLCYEMHNGSFTIWGSQPWNALAWEVSQTFVTNYTWLVDEEIIRCSNFWRAEREEAPLIVPDLSGSVLEEIV